MKGNLVYCYKVENLNDEKTAISRISKLEGVKNCKIVDGVLFYELTEWCNEYDILVASMEICANLGAELIVGEDNRADSQSETEEDNGEQLINESSEDGGRTSDFSKQNAQNDFSDDGDDIDEGKTFADKLKTEPDKDETLNEKRTKLKKDVITRVAELALSIALFVIACFVPSSSENVFNASSILFIISFAVSVYEIFYFTFIAIAKKKFYDSTVSVMIALVALVLFGALKFATIISTLYSLILSVKEYTKRHREIMLGELFDVALLDENKSVEMADDTLSTLDEKFEKSQKVNKIIGYIALIAVIFSLFTLIPQLKLTAYSILIVGIGIILAVFSDDVVKEGIINATVFAKYCEIEFRDIKNIDEIAKTNALEIDASVLTDGGTLNENAIGAMKEFVSLGIKSLKTNFDVEVSEDTREQIDFADKEFGGKKVLTIGGADKMISFSSDAENTKILSGELSSLPKAYKIAKRCKKITTITKILTRLSCLSVIGIALLPLMKNAMLTSNLLYFVIGAVALVVISALLNLINLKNK